MITKLDIFYSKLSFRMSTAKRMELYRKLASLLRNDFTLMDALDRLESVESAGGLKPNEPFAIALRAFQARLERGASFPDSVRYWVPDNEVLMLAVGDLSKLSAALLNVVRVGEGMEKIKGSMRDAVLYPLFLFALTFIVVIAVGLYLVPPLADAAGGTVVWTGVGASLVYVSDFAGRYWLWLLAVFAVILGIVWLSLPRWSGPARTIADKMPPWSMYKISVSVGWMMSLSAMTAGGISIPVAMKTLADNAPRYLRNILNETNRLITNGYNLGRALLATKTHFPDDEIIGDLAIYADMNDFDKNLSKIASDYLDSAVRKMEQLSGFLNSFGILLVSAVIAWVVFGTFQMQDQITASLS